eukprot:8237880-Ditylum_brightwellii.AAC.1
MAYVIREGPYNYGGAAITSIVDIQGVTQIKNFLHHMHKYSNESKALEIAYEWAQYQSGWGTSILEDVTSDLPHLEVRWLKSLIEYLKKIDTSIEIHKDINHPFAEV